MTLLSGVLGYAALGAAFAIEARSPLFQLGSFLVGSVGTLVFTSPTLLVLHSSWRLDAPPESLSRALAWLVVRHGRVALALTPLALCFAAAGTTMRTVFQATWFLMGVLALWMGFRTLLAVETNGSCTPFTPATPLFLAWCGLSGVVGLTLLGCLHSVTR